MARLLAAPAAFLLAVCPAGCAQKVPSPEEVLDKAIQAHGGEQAILKSRMGKASGRETGRGVVDLSWEEYFHLPNRWKRVKRGTFDGNPEYQVVIVRDGHLYIGDLSGEVERRRVSEADQLNNVFGVPYGLVKARRDKPSLSRLGNAKVKGAPAVGIKVTFDERWPNEWYFDRKSGLLVKSTALWQGSRGQTRPVHTFFSDYRNVDGVMVAHHHVTAAGERDDDIFLDTRITNVQILRKVNEELFKLP
jgi:hypothetical protein